MKIYYSALLLILIVFSVTSCVQTNKLYYFNDQNPEIQQLDSLREFAVQKIQPADRLSVTVSSTDPSLTAYLNPFNLQMSQSNGVQQSSSGYLVSSAGTIEFPLLGKVPVTGLTTSEAATLIKEKLSYYYKDLFVNVNLIGKVYVMNGRMGVALQMFNERLTIFEAIAQSGIQDPYDLKDQVMLIREDSGRRYFTKLNLNSKKIFESPYYYLHTNDLVYMKPSRYSSILHSSSPVRGIITIAGSIAAILIAIKNL
jgi:polysaccharide export outer membrane protein